MATKPIAPDPLQLVVSRRRGYRILGLSISTGQRRERDDSSFPKPIVTSPGRFGFRYSELVAYAEGLARHERDEERERRSHTAAQVSAETRRRATRQPST